jgi:hypothetical protein
MKKICLKNQKKQKQIETEPYLRPPPCEMQKPM